MLDGKAVQVAGRSTFFSIRTGPDVPGPRLAAVGISLPGLPIPD